MRRTTAKSVLFGACAFGLGWIAHEVPNSLARLSETLVAPANAQAPRPPLDSTLLALTFGVASVAVDTEATSMRVNDLTDRLSALERRISQLERQAPR